MGKDLEGLPKALIPIGNKPIIWHIMKYYAYFGFNDFILCLGYKGNDIKKYFKKNKEFKINFVDTGLNTNTGGRIKKIKKFINSGTFLATYGDGLSDLNIKRLLNFHKFHKKTATLTAVKPRSAFGILKINPSNGLVADFKEKPVLDHWINGGFFIFNPGVFDYLRDNDILEKDTFERMVNDDNLAAYKHCGFWECMDTYKDNLRLNELWLSNKPPWKIWGRG